MVLFQNLINADYNKSVCRKEHIICVFVYQSSCGYMDRGYRLGSSEIELRTKVVRVPGSNPSPLISFLCITLVIS